MHITLEHSLFRSMVRDGLKKVNYQLKSALIFLWKNIKTPIGARESQYFGLKNTGGVCCLQF
jgi:hypothetical protein